MSVVDVLFAQYVNDEVELESFHGNQNKQLMLATLQPLKIKISCDNL